MTNEEAIKLLMELRICKDDCSVCKLRHLDGDTHCHHEKALNLAIKALEQIELNPSYNGVKTELEQQPCEDWYDVPSDEMTLEQARQAVKDLRKKLAEYLEQQTSEDCISRTELLSRIDAERKHLLDLKMGGAEHIIVHHARRIIEDMPSVTPQQKIGKWVDDSEEDSYYANCSHCGYQIDTHYERGYLNYCPNCGAEMGVEE